MVLAFKCVGLWSLEVSQFWEREHWATNVLEVLGLVSKFQGLFDFSWAQDLFPSLGDSFPGQILGGS